MELRANDKELPSIITPRETSPTLTPPVQSLIPLDVSLEDSRMTMVMRQLPVFVWPLEEIYFPCPSRVTHSCFLCVENPLI